MINNKSLYLTLLTCVFPALVHCNHKIQKPLNAEKTEEHKPREPKWSWATIGCFGTAASIATIKAFFPDNCSLTFSESVRASGFIAFCGFVFQNIGDLPSEKQQEVSEALSRMCDRMAKGR